MNRIRSFVLASSFILYSSISFASEHCPSFDTINEIGNGVYRAGGNEGEWIGVMQGIVNQKPPILSFENALAVRNNINAPLKMQYCHYRAGPTQIIDMRFVAKDEEQTNIATLGEQWKDEQGPFGLIYRICENQAPEECKFNPQY